MVNIETNPTFTKPGVALLVTGVAALLLRVLLRGVPLIGGLLGVVMFLAGIFFIIGGGFLLIKKKN